MTAWPMVALGEVVEKIRSGPPVGPTFTYVDLSSVDAKRKEVVGARDVTSEDAPSRARQHLLSGDVVVSTVRPNLNGIAFVPDELSGAIASTGFTVLRSGPRVDPRYLFFWVQSPSFVTEMVRRATGASYPAVSDSIVKASKVPLPPLPEQRRIAAILDQASALGARRRGSTQISDSVKEEMAHILRQAEAYEWKSLRSVAKKYSDGPFGSNLKSEHYVDEGVRVVRLQNIGIGEFVDRDRAFISEQHFEVLRKHECLPGDVLIGTLGDPNLRATVFPSHLQRAINKADCVQFRPRLEVVLPDYVAGVLNSPIIVRRASALVLGQTRGRISMGRLGELRIPVPPLAVQQRFAHVVQAAAGAEAATKAHLAKLDELFASLQYRAFRGEL